MYVIRVLWPWPFQTLLWCITPITVLLSISAVCTRTISTWTCTVFRQHPTDESHTQDKGNQRYLSISSHFSTPIIPRDSLTTWPYTICGVHSARWQSSSRCEIPLICLYRKYNGKVLVEPTQPIQHSEKFLQWQIGTSRFGHGLVIECKCAFMLMCILSMSLHRYKCILHVSYIQRISTFSRYLQLASRVAYS